MPWAILSDNYHLDDDVVELSDAAFRLYTNGLTATQLVRSFGVITPVMIRQMTPPSWDGDVTRVTNAVTELVTAGLWIVTENRYEIRNWEKYNARDKNAPKKDVTAPERMKRYRARLKVKDELTKDESDKKRNVTKRNERNVTSYAPLARAAAEAGPIPIPIPTPNPNSQNKVTTTQKLGEPEGSESEEDARLRAIADQHKKRVSDREPAAIAALASELPIAPVGGDFVLNSSSGGTGAEARHGT